MFPFSSIAQNETFDGFPHLKEKVFYVQTSSKMKEQKLQNSQNRNKNGSVWYF
jgi:hypothetical protein